MGAGFEETGPAQQRSQCMFEQFYPTRRSGCRTRIATSPGSRRLSRSGTPATWPLEVPPACPVDWGRPLARHRDVQARGSTICQLVAFAVEGVTRSLAVDFLRAPGLRLEDVDNLLGVLEGHERAALPYPLVEGNRVEYVYARTALRDLEYRTGDFSPEGLRRAGKGLRRRVTTVGEYAVALREVFVGQGLLVGGGPKQTAGEIDAELARMGPGEYRQEAQAVTAYYRDLIAAAEWPYREQVEPRPLPPSVYLSIFPPPPVERLPTAVARFRAGLRLARCLAAVRRWQLSRPGPPTDLAEVVRGGGDGRQ